MEQLVRKMDICKLMEQGVLKEDRKIKLSEMAQNVLDKNEPFSFFTQDFNLDKDVSIIRNDGLHSDSKIEILNAMDTIRTKRSKIRQDKKDKGVLFDSRTAEEDLFASSTISEKDVLDKYIMQTHLEKAYRLFTIRLEVLEWNEDHTNRPKCVQYVVESVECTKTGQSKRSTLALARVSRNYVQLSDFIVLNSKKEQEIALIVNNLFEIWNETKKVCENWQGCVESLQRDLREYKTADFNTVMYWIENNIQKMNIEKAKKEQEENDKLKKEQTEQK